MSATLQQRIGDPGETRDKDPGRPARKATLFLVALLLILITPSFVQQAALAADPPQYIHLTWNNRDMAHTIVVTWSTTASGSGDTVEYGTSPSSYTSSASGTYHTYSTSNLYVHDVVLTGLSADTTYYFICGGTGGYSTERAFHTAPETSKPILFVAGGDSQTNETPREAISQRMATFSPSFVLRSGDYTNSDTDPDWPLVLRDISDHWIGTGGLTIPLIGAVGNHEEGANTFKGQFSLPNNELWYSMDWGPDLHIVVLDSEASLTGAQLTWLTQDLAANANVKWKIASFHRSPYSAGSYHASDLNLRSTWGPLFDRYGVDVVFNGHDHHYERSKPVFDQNVAADAQDGTTYFVSGGWGSSLRSVGADWWTASAASLYHFLVVEIDGDAISIKAVNPSGTIFDSVQWQKTPPNVLPTADFSFTPAIPDVGTSVRFRDRSTDPDGSVRAWSWSFGDGGTSAVQNPTHAYAMAGTFTVVLTVKDNLGGTASLTKRVRSRRPSRFPGR